MLTSSLQRSFSTNYPVTFCDCKIYLVYTAEFIALSSVLFFKLVQLPFRPWWNRNYAPFFIMYYLCGPCLLLIQLYTLGSGKME